MKAIDYYEQYGMAVLAESYHDDKHEELTKLVMAFLEDMQTIIADRKIHSDRGAVSVIKEQNAKWNALIAIFEKKHEGVTPLKRNGFLEFIKAQIPELERWDRK